MQLANLTTGVLLARMLGPALRGQIAALTALVYSVSQLTSITYADSLVFWLSRYRDQFRKYLGSGLVVAAGVGGIGVVILFFLAPTMGHIAGVPPRTLWAWILFPLAAQVCLFGATAARGLNMPYRWTVARITSTTNYAFILIAFTLVGWLTPGNIGLAMVAGLTSSALISTFLLAKPLSHSKIDYSALREITIFATKMHPSSFSTLAREQFDKFILFYLVSPVDLGHYVVGVALGILPVAAAGTIDQVIFPALAALKDNEARKEACLAQIRTVSALIIASAVLLLPMTPLLVCILFGSEYIVDVGVPMSAVAIGFIQSLRVVFNMALKIEHRPGTLGLNESLGVGLSLALIAPLVSWLGIYGAPLASAIGGMLALSLTIGAIKSIYAVPLRQIIFMHRGDFRMFLRRISKAGPITAESKLPKAEQQSGEITEISGVASVLPE